MPIFILNFYLNQMNLQSKRQLISESDKLSNCNFDLHSIPNSCGLVIQLNLLNSSINLVVSFLPRSVVMVNRDKKRRFWKLIFHVWESTIRHVVHEDIRHRSYIKKEGKFMSSRTQKNQVISSKSLLNKVKHSKSC